MLDTCVHSGGGSGDRPRYNPAVHDVLPIR